MSDFTEAMGRAGDLEYTDPVFEDVIRKLRAVPTRNASEHRKARALAEDIESTRNAALARQKKLRVLAPPETAPSPAPAPTVNRRVVLPSDATEARTRRPSRPGARLPEVKPPLGSEARAPNYGAIKRRLAPVMDKHTGEIERALED